MPSGTKISLEKRALLAYHFNGVKSTWEFVADNLFLPNEISRLTIKRLWCCMEEWKEEQFDAFIRGDNPASESSSLIARGSAEEDVLTDVDDGQQDAVRFKCRPKGSALASKALTITAMKTAMERKIQLEIEVVEDCGAGGKYKAETWLGVSGAHVVTFLEKLSDEIDDYSFLILDNASNQKTPEVRQKAQEVFAGKYRYVCTYSPELKPIERGFSNVKRFIRERDNEVFWQNNPIGLIESAFQNYRAGTLGGREAFNHFRIYYDNHDIYKRLN